MHLHVCTDPSPPNSSYRCVHSHHAATKLRHAPSGRSVTTAWLAQRHALKQTHTCASCCCLLAWRAASKPAGTPGPSSLNRSPAKGILGWGSSSSGMGNTGRGLCAGATGGRTMVPPVPTCGVRARKFVHLHGARARACVCVYVCVCMCVCVRVRGCARTFLLKSWVSTACTHVHSSLP